MPISKDQFEEIGDRKDRDGPTPGTNAAKILSFLRTHPNKAFTQSEIAEKTDVTSGSVGPTLVRLRERGRVDHRGKYWRVSDHDQSVDTATGHAATALAAREDDNEKPQMTNWQEHAVDPREHRNAP
ncbi:ArsR family transcriptional regulator [Salinadaptatus halalkaliphilus]|uniref:ArsR family transcriptional regulator n=1 Tax=Salinadaptatus halalkaliphilus TaxID=2419781 RepID=A0A4S3TRA1_9EURY|nr:ArsR family transcriptional regulator [Salinadaptatus halalkaliphilus]